MLARAQLTIRDELLLHPTSQAAATYRHKVIAYGPLAYWMLAETSGTAARCQIDATQNGTHNGPTLGQAGIGDRLTCPYFDGINDRTNIYTTALNTNLNGAEGTWFTWAKVTAASEWTDPTNRHLLMLMTSTGDFVNCFKWNANPNRILLERRGGGVDTWPQITGMSTTDWFSLALTWSQSADQVRAFLNGSQVGSTLTGLGAWTGTLDSAKAAIGANSGTSPTSFWKGWLAHTQLYDTALSPTQIADLHTLP